MDQFKTLILLDNERVRQTLIGILATKDILVLARVTNAILAGQRLRTNFPVDIQFAKAQDCVGAMPDHSKIEIEIQLIKLNI